jgi:hypothetical protein
MIGATIPEDGLSSAAIGLGLPPHTSKGGVFRAALAVLAGMSRDEARRYAASTPGKNELGTDGTIYTTALVPEELLDAARTAFGSSDNTAYLVRVGLAMAAGYSRKQAENWAVMRPGPVPKQSAA